ncbi:unnamed protein product [Caenorhabditis angaria]|uniref:Uncharacterized protein n=1 Tax=Caenorhabditis angaria TaxID=860376 RepID=A0A9P1IAM8_9PELO|nr:unnamed protein product [Caenorhabditis angaria]
MFRSIFFILLITILAVNCAVLRTRRQVIHNLVNDRFYGGPTSLGWAQVPHIASPIHFYWGDSNGPATEIMSTFKNVQMLMNETQNALT